jgi:hypothetical protein
MSMTKPTPADVLPATEAEEARLRQVEENQEAIALLDSWANASEAEIEEQRETWEFLRKALDEDRPSYRKLFP